ncbi:RNA-directed DNA polymerase from mobile element jockey [Trichonephila clavipes]|uniref:RNA-directed DNA polymerase from mobile element jockey n=1 Tax=Trichonephila clavipes TaxID=2585209 RepID=A0A8X7BHZ0_TRICX|nr:RNA-directed DNA polymerase from mobile element jockey [Trichonephila clavipes]
MLPKPNKDLKFPINFRPISLISSIAKIFEKILLSRIQQHATDNSIIPDFQHGFRKETSTCHQLLRVANKIIHGFNHSKTTGGLFLDVEKAFDRLWHNGLIYKMIHLHFPDYLIYILADYLNDRTFQIKIDATISRTGQIQAGCPQGSNLSPILYNIYTHDFPTSPGVEICLFADDAAIVRQAASPQDVRTTLQKYLMKLKKWLKLWRISINTTKSRAILFKKGSFKNKLQPLRLFGNSINWFDDVEYLGVVLDKKFTFKTHLDKITCKFKTRLRALHKLLNNKSRLSIHNKRSIYLQYLLPIITYASPIWGCAAACHINKLQILQNRALRLILNAPTYTKRIHLHRDLKIPALSSRIRKLATNFHDQAASHPNSLINTQPFIDAQGIYKMPIHSSRLKRLF